MMISGFKWEDEIDRAGMSSGITKQMLSYCVDVLIPKLEQRRFWVEAFNALNAQYAPMLQQDLQNEYFFEKLARKWKFVRDAGNRRWELYFVAMIKPPPEVDADAIAPDGDAGPAPGDANPRAMRPPNDLDDGARAHAAVDVQPSRSARESLREFYVLQAKPKLFRVALMLRAASWMAHDAAERLGERVGDLFVSLHLKRAKVAASLTAMVREMREAAAFAPRHVAQLEFVRVRIGANQTMELAQYREEQPDWSSWLFGRPEEEDFALH
jgi:hypothetical protein